MRAVLMLGVLATTTAVAAADDGARIDRTVGAAAARCAQAKTAATHGDLTAAMLLADACPAGDPAIRQLRRDLAAAHYGTIAIVTKPAGAEVALTGRPDLAVRGDDDLWLPPGDYTITGGGLASAVTVPPDGRAIALLELPRGAAPTDHQLDFGDEGGGDVVIGPPPKEKHKSLLPDRYQRLLAVEGGGGELVEDDVRDPDRARLGAWAGPAATARTGDGWGGGLGFTVAAVARTHARGRFAAQVELAWAHRPATHAGMTVALDALALPIAAHVRLWRGEALTVGALTGAAVALRLDRALGDLAIDRVGAHALTGLDAELTSTPLRLEVRGELDLTTLGSAGRAWSIGASVGVLLF